MKEYFVSYLSMTDKDFGAGNAFIKSDKSGRELVEELVNELIKLDSNAVMINYVELKSSHFYNSNLWRKKREEVLRQNTPRECNYCRKHHTEECPNSFYCYSTDDKPHFEPR